MGVGIGTQSAVGVSFGGQSVVGVGNRRQRNVEIVTEKYVFSGEVVKQKGRPFSSDKTLLAVTILKELNAQFL